MSTSSHLWLAAAFGHASHYPLRCIPLRTHAAAPATARHNCAVAILRPAYGPALTYMSYVCHRTEAVCECASNVDTRRIYARHRESRKKNRIGSASATSSRIECLYAGSWA